MNYSLRGFLNSLRFFGHTSYSQYSEDFIAYRIFKDLLNKPRPRYLDVGANHPVYGNNTYLMYKNGGSGVLVEPSHTSARLCNFIRRRDLVLEIGIAPLHLIQENPSILFEFYPSTLNTFSSSSAQSYLELGHRLIRKSSVSYLSLEKVLNDNKPFDFLSLDIEGLDLDVLRECDIATHDIDLICLETVAYSSGSLSHHILEYDNVMSRNGYTILARTPVNTLYISNKAREIVYAAA